MNPEKLNKLKRLLIKLKFALHQKPYRQVRGGSSSFLLDGPLNLLNGLYNPLKYPHESHETLKFQ